jgi:nucleotide-binding universal stress UspA family protein
MQIVTLTEAGPEVGVGASRVAPLIVATDGRIQSDAALTIGQLLAGANDAMRVVNVLKPIPILPDVPMTLSPNAIASRRADARHELIGQAVRVLGDDRDVELRDGDPATVISRLAHGSNAVMIVCGLGRHRVADRIFGDETALRLIRMADVPVLAVAKGVARVPTRIVVAVDFSETSLRAARLSLQLAGAKAAVYLVHVAPRDGVLYDEAYSGAHYKHDAGNALLKMRDLLRVPKGATVQNVLLQGDPVTELLAFAASINADLIATGNQGHGFVARMLVGSVTTRIVRCATCSVLTVPHAAAMTRVRITAGPPTAARVDRVDWPAMLRAFSRRNEARLGTLEVDDPEIDAQAQVIDYPFRGVAFDPHDERLELMFGDGEGGGRHLARGITGVTSIVVLRDERGRDDALRIAHGLGLTVLTFAS